MKTQNKHGLIFFLLAFTIVLVAFFSFAPKSSKPNHLAENAQQETEPMLRPFYGKTDQELAAEDAQPKPWEMDWSAAKSANHPQEQTGWNNEITTPYQQEMQNNNLATTPTYSYTNNPSYNYHSSADSNSDKYVYRTHPVEDTGSQISNDYYQTTESYSIPRSNYDDYSSTQNSYNVPIPTPNVAPQPTHMTSCDGSGCWDNQGNRYSGNNGTYFQQNGGMCRDIGGMVQCN